MSKIEWTDKTWNPIVGCSKISDGCKNCYAEKMAFRLANMDATRDKYESVLINDLWEVNDFIAIKNRKSRLELKPLWNGEVYFDEKELNRKFPGKGKKIFVCSMSDLFHEKVKDKWIRKIFDKIWQNPQHTFQILTKRPEKMKEFVKNWAYQKWFGWGPDANKNPMKCGEIVYLDNLFDRNDCGWATSKDIANDNNGYLCLHPDNEEKTDNPTVNKCFTWACPIATKGVNKKDIPLDERDDYEYDDDGFTSESEELMILHSRPRHAFVQNLWLGVTVENAETMHRIETLKQIPAAVRFVSFEPLLSNIPNLDLTGIDWVIVGGETGTGARYMGIEWISNIFVECKKLNIPFFFKGWGTHALRKTSANYKLFGEREWNEFPEVKK
jgi:protein gp37